MPDKIIHLRSLTPGAVPVTSSLGIGELAINVNDGKIFLRQSGSLGDTVQTAVTTNNVTTGSITISGSVKITGSLNSTSITSSLFGTSSWAQNALTASYFITSSVTSASYSVSASYSQTASYGINIVVSGSINNADYIQFNTAASVTDAIGRLYFDSGEGTLKVGLVGGNVVANIGEDLYQYVYNSTGAPLNKGQIVYISGSQGNRIAVKLASAQAEEGSANTLGFVAENIGVGAEGWVQTEGVLRKLNTVGLVAGQLLYLSTTPGAYTQTAPTAPNHGVRLGYPERIDATVGSIYIKIDNGYELGEIHNVLDLSTTSSYGDLLVKSGSVWINNKQLTGSYGLTGSMTITGSLNLSTPVYNTSSINVLTINTSSNAIEYSTINDLTFTKNIVTVGLSGSRGVKYNVIKNAVSSITDASQNNTYTVRVSPGIYIEDTITVPSWVAIKGDSSISTIVSASNPSQSVFIMSDQSMVIDMQIQGSTYTGSAAVYYSSPTTPQTNAIAYVENVRFGTNYTNAKVVGSGSSGNCILQCSNVKYGGYTDSTLAKSFDVGFYVTSGSSGGIGRMQLRNVTSTNGGVAGSDDNQIFALADAPGCTFIVNGCLLTRATGAAKGTGFKAYNGASLRLTSVNFQRWTTAIDMPNTGSAPSIYGSALNFENDTYDVIITHPSASGHVDGLDTFLKSSIPLNAPVYEINTDPRKLIVAKKGGDFTSVSASVAWITDSSATNRYIVSVGPGEFIEKEIDLTNKPYVSIVGSDIQATQIIASGSNQNLFKVGNTNELSFMTLTGNNASGYAAIVAEDFEGFSLVHKLSIYDFDYGIKVASSGSALQFYGEYVDINGSFSYGTYVSSSNGALVDTSMENYFLFPSASSGVGNFVAGPSASLGVKASVLTGDATANSTAFELRDGAVLEGAAVDIPGWDVGLYVPSIGTGPKFRLTGTMFHNSSTYDFNILNSTTQGRLIGIADHSKINNNSPDFYWSFLDDTDGELDITRKMSVTFQDGTHTDATTLIFNGSPMGVMSGGTITVSSGLTITTSAGYGYCEDPLDTGVYKRIDWNNSNITLSANSNNYIYINYNGILSASGTAPSSLSNIILGRVVTNKTTIEIIDQSPYDGAHMSNKISKFNRDALGPVYADGSIVTENVTPFRLNVTQGSYFFSENNFTPSGGTAISMGRYYPSASSWNTSSIVTIPHNEYASGSSLIAMSSSYYTKHTLYLVGDGVNEKYFLIVNSNQYATLVETENADLPTPPTYFNDSVVSLASVYVQSGSANITQIQDIRPIIGFRAAGVNASSVHGNLLGLNADDHTQYLLVNGGRQMSGDLGLGGNDLYNFASISGSSITSSGASITDIKATSITGSLLGTATNALTASYITQAVSSSYALTASYLLGQISSASYASTASYVETARTASYFITSSVTSASFSATASYVVNSLTASYFLTSSVTSASYARTASYVETARTASYFITSSVTSASYAATASYVVNALTASYFITSSVTSASYAATASYVVNALTASYFITSSVTSASYARTASYVDTALTASYFITSSVTSASYAISSSRAALAGNSNTIDVNVFGADVDSYLLMSNVAGTSGVAIGGDADLRYNSSTNKLTVGSVSATNLTGSLFGTSSWAQNSLTASVFITSSVTSASYAATASYVVNALTASYFLTSSVTSASFAATASSADSFNVRTSATASNLLVSNTITAQTLIVQTITASVEYSSGSNIFGSKQTDVQQFTGSVSITGSLTLVGQANITGITGSHFGTSSWALNFITSSVTSASYSSTASFSQNSISSSYLSGSAAIVTDLTSSNDVSISGVTIGRGGGNSLLNTAFGNIALALNTTGTGNVAVGSGALNANSTGLNNTAIGRRSLLSNDSGSSNVAIGRDALLSNSTGSFNTALGTSAIASNGTGNNNTAIGYRAGYGVDGALANFSGNNNIFIGYQSIGISTSDSNRTWIGNSSTITTWLGGNLLLGSASNNGYIAQINISGSASGSLFVSGSSVMSGSLIVTQGITSSLFGTSSWAQNFLTSSITSASYSATASYVANALTASYFITSSVTSASYAATASLFITSSVTSASFASTASYVVNALTASYFITSSVTSASYAATASYVVNALTASYFITSSVTSASFASTASFINTLSQSVVITGSINLTGSLNIIGGGFTGSHFGTSSWAINALTASVFITSSVTSASYAATASYVVNSLTASYFITGSVTSASYARTASYVDTALTASYFITSSVTSASFAATASSLNTLNQNVLITGSLTVGASSIGSSENTLTLGPRGLNEGGQLLLQSPVSAAFNSASMLDIYADTTSNSQFLRILRGSNAGSDAIVSQFNLHTKQFTLPAYQNASSFGGTATANLAVDTNGNVITVSTSGTPVFPYTGTAGITGSISVVGTPGAITASGAIVSLANGTMYFRGGDDAEFWDINVANTVGIYGQQDQTVGGLKLGSGGGTLTGKNGNIGIGTINPTQGTLEVNGNIYANSLTGSLFGTSSWAQNARTASVFITSSVTSASYAATASYVVNALTASYFITSSVTSASYAATASYVVNALTASYFITSSVTSASYAATASYVVNALTASYFITSSVTSASYAATASSADSFLIRNNATASNLLVNNTITAQTLVVQTITASVEYSSGSNIFGNKQTDSQQFTGSVTITGSFGLTGQATVTGITGSHFGTSSWAINALTASYFVTSSVTSASYAATASYVVNALTASVFITSSVTSASYAATASYVVNALTASYFITSSVTSASYAATASYVVNALTSSYFITSSVTSASYAATASYVVTALTASYFITSSVTSASYAATASYVVSALTASYFITSSVTSASYAATASLFITSSVTSASFASSSRDFVISNTLRFADAFMDTAVVASSIVGSNNIFTLDTGSATSAVFQYTVSNGGNTRTGQVLSGWNGNTVTYTDISSPAIGTTLEVTFSIAIVSSQLQFNANTTTSGWRLKAMITMI